MGNVHLTSFLTMSFFRLTKRDGCGRSPLHVAVVMNDALAAMELLHLCVPTQIHDIYGLTPAVSARNRGFFYADIIDRTPADQWIVLKRVGGLVPNDTADPRGLPSSPPSRSPSSGSTRAAGPSGPTPPGAARSSPSTSARRKT